MATDRSILKQQQAGALNSPSTSAANAIATVASAHSRPYNFVKFGAENSSNNVVETTMFTVIRAGTIKAVRLVANGAVAANATNGFVCTVAKRTANGSAVTVATWNTDTAAAAEGAIVAWSPHTLSLVTSSDATLAAADVLTFKCTKFGVGLLLPGGTAITVDVEEI